MVSCGRSGIPFEEIARYYSKSEKVSFFADGVLSEYYNIMNQVLDQLEQINPNAMVAPNVGDVDEAEIDRRTSMLREMTPSMLSEARALMLVKWQDKLNKLPISSRGRFSSEPPHSFLVSEYYLTVEEIVAQNRRPVTSSTGHRRPTFPVATIKMPSASAR